MAKNSYKNKYKIGVSGAAETGHCSEDALQKAEEIGREIIRQGCILITGATTGISFWSAKGAKEQGGTVIGFSPAASEKSHLNTYRLPLDYHDDIIYTGSDYAGRNLQLVRATDAIIIICGRIGTLNEFTIAFEDQKPIGILEESGGIADMVSDIVKNAHRGPGQIIYDKNPKALVEKLIKIIRKEKNENQKLGYLKRDASRGE